MTEKRTILDGIRVGVIILTLATAVMHIALLFPDTLFILNGLGYVTLLAALYLPIPQLAPYRHIFRWLLLGYTALTVGIWLVVGWRGIYAYVNKAIEVALIVLLWLDGRR